MSISLTPVGPSLCLAGLTMGYASLRTYNSTELILCPFTTLLFKEDVDAIEISSNNIETKCEMEVLYFKQCIFEEGKHHF